MKRNRALDSKDIWEARMGKSIKKISWQKSWWIFDYGYDKDFGTGIINNKVSTAISIKGYWVGIAR